MTRTAVLTLAVLAAAGDVVCQLPDGVHWCFSMSEEVVTGEPDARPTLEVVTRSRAEFESVCRALANKMPASAQTEVLLKDDGGLEVSILDPAWMAKDAELKTRKVAVARLVRANVTAAGEAAEAL